MANNMPSLTALLGLAAVAGWQNRDKIADFAKGLTGGTSPAAASAQAIPGGLSGALGGLITHMQSGGVGDIANSWVGTGTNLPISGGQLSQVLGPDLVNKISASTGLSPEQILTQLSAVLPQLVDKLTPQGHLPRA